MSVVTVTRLFANEEEARTIGRTLVEERLAACVNIGGPVHSIYPLAGRDRGSGRGRGLVQDHRGDGRQH